METNTKNSFGTNASLNGIGIDSIKRMFFIGIDVGITGGWAIIDSDGKLVDVSIFDGYKGFEKKIKSFGENYLQDTFGVLEQVSAMRGQGVSSMFTFGQNYGGWQATLELIGVSYQLIPPRRWQKEILGIFPKGESKIRALAFAKRRWPTLNLKKKDHGIVDALCIALYAKTLYQGALHQESPRFI